MNAELRQVLEAEFLETLGNCVWSLRAAWLNFPQGLLRTPVIQTIHLKTAEVADSLEILTGSFNDLFLEGNDMEKDAIQTGRPRGGSSAAVPKSAAVPESTAALEKPADQQEPGDNPKEGAIFDLVEIISALADEEGKVNREAMIETATRVFGIRHIVEQLEAVDDKLGKQRILLLTVNTKLDDMITERLRIEGAMAKLDALETIRQQLENIITMVAKK